MTTVELKKRLREHGTAFLKNARTVRIWLQGITIGAPVIVGCSKALPTTLPDPWPAVLITLQFVFLGIAALAGLVVLLTDRSALVVMADAQEAADQAEAARGECDSARRFIEQLESELSKAATLGLTIDAMRYAVDVALTPTNTSTLELQIRDMLDQLVVAKNTLFEIGDEQWNFSVYLWNEASAELKCVACRRPSRGEEDALHRSWKSGEGHVGKAYQMKRALICADSADLNVRGFFDAPEDKRADYDDTTRYRSLAAIPVQLPGESEPYGVVVATSNIAGRFRPTAEGDDFDTVKPVRALSKTLATLLAVIKLKTQREHDNAGQ